MSSGGFSGTGVRTYSLFSGGNCSLVGTRLSTSGQGTCIVEVSIDQDDRYSVSSDTLTIVVADPPAPAGGGSSGGSNSSQSDSPSTGTAGSNSTVTFDTDVVISNTEAGTETSTAENGNPVVRGRKLPPAPVKLQVVSNKNENRSRVTAVLPRRAASEVILSTVVVVRDANGKVVSRLSISVNNSDTTVSVDIPFLASGYTVSVYNVNDLGVSAGGLKLSPLVYASTINKRDTKGVPDLFGAPTGKPIYFGGGSSALDAADKEKLREIAAKSKVSLKRLFVTGFARMGGGDSQTLRSLSTDRARAVAMYLAQQGVRVWIRYYGAGSLKGTGSHSDRRVEIRESNDRIPKATSMIR